MATQAELNARILRSLQRVGVSSTESADYTSLLNEVIREDICGEFDWPFMWDEDTQQTVDGTSAYTFGAGGGFTPADFADCKQIQYRTATDEEWTVVKEESYPALLERYPEETSGPPRAWALSGYSATGTATFELRPVPDDDYYVRTLCSVYPAALSGSSSNWLTVRYPKLVEAGVVARALLGTSEAAKAQVWLGLFRDLLQSAVKRERLRAGRRNGSMRRSAIAEMPAIGTRRWGAHYLRGDWAL